MEATPLASLSLTHVHYNASDPVSYLCAWLALIPQTLCVIYVTLMWSSREVEILFMFVGQMGCEALNFLLKRAIKEERPKQMNGKGYGMPSSHAQFVTYWSLYLTLILFLRHHPPPTPAHADDRPYTHRPFDLPQKLLFAFSTSLMAILVATSRIYLNYHTPIQVLVGSLAGAVSAVGWYFVTEWLRREGWVEWALDCWVARVGRWRDLAVEEDLVESGWRVWEERRRRRGEGRGANGGVVRVGKKKRR